MTDRAPASTDSTPPADTSVEAAPSEPASSASGARAAGTRAAGTEPSATRAAGTVVVRIPGPLRPLADGAGDVEVEGATVAGVLERLVLRHPGLRRHLLTDTGGVRDYVNVFVGDEDARTLDGMDTTVGPGEVITIVPSIAGG